MAIYHQDIADIELNSGSLHRSFLGHSIGMGDAAANRFGVRVFRDGVAETLSSVTCQGFFRNANGQNIALTSYGTISGNVAYVTLPQACYNVEGRFTLAIKLVGGGVTGTMRIVDGMVDNTNTGSAVAPTGSVPTYQEVLSVYEQMQAALTNYDAKVTEQDGKIGDLQSTLNSFESYYNARYTWTIGTAQRNYINLGQTVAKLKITVAVGAWCAVQGWTDSAYSETKVYDSGTFTTTTEIAVNSEITNLYYRLVLGVNSGSITNAQRENSVVYKKFITVDDTLTEHNIPAEAYTTGEAIKSVTEYKTNLPISWETSTRGYVSLGAFVGDIECKIGTNVWCALQGWDTPTYDGVRQYDSGAIYTNTVFSANSNDTGYYYRIVYGSSSGITDAAKSMCSAEIEKDYKNLIGEMIKTDKTVNHGVFSVMHGGTTSYPSNTIGLYRKAYENGIMYWECDVRPCADGYVLCHDNDIYNHAVTSTGGTIPQNTVLISNSTIAQLQQYKFGVITNQQSNGVVEGFELDTIPTLQEFLLFAKAVGAFPVIEIKFTPTQAQMNEICNIIKYTGMLEQSYILAYQDAENVISYACQNGIKRLFIIINNGEGSTSAIDTAYSYIEQYTNQLDDVIFDPAVSNYSYSLAVYGASKHMRMGVWTIPENMNKTVVNNLYNAYCTAFTTNKHNVTQEIRNAYLNA